jgi:hypothetical protein
VTTVTLTGTPGLKVYEIRDADSANAIFAVSANYTYNTALPATTSPFGDKGFVVMRKGGDALSLERTTPWPLVTLTRQHCNQQSESSLATSMERSALKAGPRLGISVIRNSFAQVV